MQDLIGKVQEAYASNENQKKLNNREQFKIIIGLGRTVLSKVIGFSMNDYFIDSKTCLESQLKWKLLWHNEIKDDTFLDLSCGIDYSTALEPALFGQEPVFSSEKDPTYGHALLNDESDLNRLDVPDFYKSGFMPEAHRMYREIGELAKGNLNICFPGWARGPWSIATIIRGFQNLFLDTIDNPEFVHRLMAFIVTCRKSWEEERCKFLGISPHNKDYRWKYVVYRTLTSSDLFEDEVDGNLFPPKVFEEFILPFVRDLSEYYGGISYYHSCGNMTPFIPCIKQSGVQDLFQVSPWSDYERMVDELPEGITIQKALHPANDVLMASEEKMRDVLQKIISKAKGRKVEIWADALYEGSWDTLEKVKQLVRIFREVVGQKI